MKLVEMTSAAVRQLPRSTPVVIPIGALEQHGPHLPVLTDSMLLGEVCRRSEERLADRVLFAPVLWLGNSDHHLDFPGTMSASPRVYLDLLRDLVESFLRHQFCRILLLNGHGGNIVPGQQALYEVRQKYRERQDLLLLFASYWALGSQPAEQMPELTHSQILHACQWETSMVQRLRPDLVAPTNDLEATNAGRPFPPAYRASIIQEMCSPGYVGDPRSATPEIGERLFELFTGDVVSFLQRVSEWDGQSWNG